MGPEKRKKHLESKPGFMGYGYFVDGNELLINTRHSILHLDKAANT
jgi:hypothetical protein